MTGQHSTLYGTRPSGPGRFGSFATSVLRCCRVQASSGRWVCVSTSAPARGGVPSPVRQTAMLRSGITSAPTLQPRWLDAALDKLGKILRRPAVGRLVLGVAEQQLEIAVPHDEVALQLADVVLRAELALQAIEHGPQQALDQRERPRLAALRGFAAHDAGSAHQHVIVVAQ